jgi:hypothetical protein
MLNRKASLVKVCSGMSSHLTTASTDVGDGLACDWDAGADAAGAALTGTLADGDPDRARFD